MIDFESNEKYFNNAKGYLQDKYGIDEYTFHKYSEKTFSDCIHVCPCCSVEQFVYIPEENAYYCFSCGEIIDADKIIFCTRCDEPMLKDESKGLVCKRCYDDLLELFE